MNKTKLTEIKKQAEKIADTVTWAHDNIKKEWIDMYITSEQEKEKTSHE